ncbi:heavy-metal-associated domain-containing protein [Candidatus Nitrosacidococcus tergens]|uniref:Heavy metal transport/detoxification protein n=1 Tax=Candidatus Nitrosacidococcus tergens TaxID=553981 RepID=A0A7G1QBV8_9GAMM|nr:heavy metal-associated domain-containing protein [Candidatus Nitrosacidococcus tergens]CAB1277473.1 Heavy metal transport/detoxification protein [Candidatus Nitrosacidococcus tergens]
MEKIYKVGGMTCQGCARSVENAIINALPEATVTVDLEKKQVTVTDINNDTLVAKAIEESGFDYEGVVS